MWSKNKTKYVRALAQKKVRDAEGVFLAEGGKIIEELASAFQVRMAVATPQWLANHPLPSGMDVDETDEKELERASSMKSPQGILAVFGKPENETVFPIRRDELYLALDGVQDPGNVGTIIRLADWLGIGRVVCSPDTADVFAPKTVQATMGALAHVKVTYTDLTEWLAGLPEGFPVYGTFMNGENLYETSVSLGGVIVMGSEGRGISLSVEAFVNRRISIPCYPPGRVTVESLNVAVATAMTCAEFRRRVSLSEKDGE